jgi:hypothetical protein
VEQFEKQFLQTPETLKNPPGQLERHFLIKGRGKNNLI